MEQDALYYECHAGKTRIVPKFYVEWKEKSKWDSNYEIFLKWVKESFTEGIFDDQKLMDEMNMPRASIDKLIGPLWYRHWRRSPYGRKWSYNELVRKIGIAYHKNPHLTDGIMNHITGIPIENLIAIRSAAKFYDLPRLRYDDEFKEMILRELEKGRTIASVCFEHELSPNTISFWKKAKNERAS